MIGLMLGMSGVMRPSGLGSLTNDTMLLAQLMTPKDSLDFKVQEAKKVSSSLGGLASNESSKNLET